MAPILKINTSTNPVSLKEMSSSEYNYTTYIILNKFAASDTGVATVSVNPAVTTGLTSIGSFVDTYRNFAVGTHPVANTITTANTYTFYQDLRTASESLTRPLEYTAGVKEENDTNLNADVISVALANLVSNGVGCYALTSSSPVGGTWTSKATIVDTVNPTTTNTTYLWRKTAHASVPSTVRPLKINATTPPSLKEMSDVEIETLTDRLRNRIVTTGVGKYAVQQSAPVGGTWITQGSSFSDTRNTLTNESYSGSYSGTYTGNYTGSYSRSFSGTYSRAFSGSYSGSYRVFYAGFGGPLYTGSYTGSYTGNFTGSYTGNFSGTYAGNYTGSYTGSYTGATVNNAIETVSTVSLWLRTA